VDIEDLLRSRSTNVLREHKALYETHMRDASCAFLCVRLCVWLLLGEQRQETQLAQEVLDAARLEHPSAGNGLHPLVENFR
jgi:hypothetical protein